MPTLVLLITALALCVPASAASEDQAVLAAVQRLFDAMEARDPAAASAVLIPKGGYFSVRDKAGEISVSGVSHEDLAARLARDKEPIKEVMHDPKVLVHGRIASVWMPYRFFRSGKISHCGIDSFNLIKTADGWKIAGFIYTVEPCAP